MSYLLPLSSGLALGGRPFPGTLRIASKPSLVYKASWQNGLQPALFRRCLTVFLSIFSFSAISETVIPVISPIIGSLSLNNENVNKKVHFTTYLYSSLRKKVKKVTKLVQLKLTKCN